jgi:hypothetical protein
MDTPGNKVKLTIELYPDGKEIMRLDNELFYKGKCNHKDETQTQSASRVRSKP